MRSPEELISLARHILEQGSTKPSQTTLRRAVSTVYYALFHTLSKTGADLLVGKTKSFRSEPAWRQVYQGLNHGPARKACEQKATMENFPQSIRKFGRVFVEMQQARSKADYNPHSKFSKSVVAEQIARTQEAMKDFSEADVKEQKAFCVHVLFKSRA